MSKVDKSLIISDKIVKLLEDEQLDFDHSIYAVMSTLLHLHLGKTHCKMNEYLNRDIAPGYFVGYLENDWKRCEGISTNILERIKEMDRHMLLNYFEQKKIRYQKSKLSEHEE